MNILVTGAKGFIGGHLCCRLNELQTRNNAPLFVDRVFKYDRDNTEDELFDFLTNSDFIFNFVGVSRPENKSDFKLSNVEFARKCLSYLASINNKCPVMVSSSIQAAMVGRFANSEYAITKRECEEIYFDYATKHKVDVYVYRFPNVFGRWKKPNSDSVIATFCYNISRNIPIQINGRDTLIELLYIEDLVDELLNILLGKVRKCEFNGLSLIENANGHYCFIPETYKVTLGYIVDLLDFFHANDDGVFTSYPKDSFEMKLLETYRSYLSCSETIGYS